MASFPWWTRRAREAPEPEAGFRAGSGLLVGKSGASLPERARPERDHRDSHRPRGNPAGVVFASRDLTAVLRSQSRRVDSCRGGAGGRVAVKPGKTILLFGRHRDRIGKKARTGEAGLIRRGRAYR